jgi:pyridoxine 5-phosphate synthase
VAGSETALRDTVRRCQDAGMRVSLFIDPESVQIEAAARLGVEMIELHTGNFAVASGRERQDEVLMLAAAARLAHQLGLQVNAGHGITTLNVVELFIVPHLIELNVGHHLVCRAIETGLTRAVAELKAVMDRYPATE